MANTKVTGDLIASSTIATGNIADNAVTSDKISGITTAHITEGANLYYTDARADARAALLVDSAPSTLNTLNELAAALGDDPNFATTTATSLGLKAPLASPSFTGNSTFAGNVEIRSGNKLILQRPNNAVATEISTDATGAMVLNSLNVEGFDFQNNGVNVLSINAAGNATFAGDVTVNGGTLLVGTDTVLAGGVNRGNITINGASNSILSFGIAEVLEGYLYHDGSEMKLNTGSVPLIFEVNNSERLRIDSSGNSTFAGTVETTTLRTDVINNKANSANIIYRSGTSTLVGGGTTANKLYVLDNGRVGIGTTSPAYKLQVQDANAAIVYVKSTTNNQNASIWFNSNSGGTQADRWEIGTNISAGTDLEFFDRLNSVSRMVIQNDGKVGIGTISPDEKLEISGTGSVYPNIKFSFPGVTSRYMRIGMVSAVKYEFEVNGSGTYMVFKTEGVERMQINSTYVKIAAGKQLRIGDYFHIGSGDSSYMGSLGFNRDTSNGDIFNSSYGAYQIHNYQGTLKLQVYNAAGSTIGEHQFFNNGKASFFNGIAIGQTSSPVTRLAVRGALGIGPAIADGNIAYSSTNFSHQDGGALHMNYSLGGNSSSGDTITFTYAATTWKSWSLKYNFASTSGITYGVVGGYWNNSGGSSNHTEHNNHGVSVAVTHTGQGNTVTFTFTNLGTHPMAQFVYMQGGGDGQPRADRVTLNGAS